MVKNKISEKKAVDTSLLVSTSDVLLNLIVGLVTGSVVVISQSLQGLSDLVTAGVLYRGVTIANQKASKKHPFGRGREVFFYVLLAGLIMFAGTGIASVMVGVNKVLNPSGVSDVWLAFSMLTFGLLSNAYSFNISRKRLGFEKPTRKNLKKLISSSMVETKATFIVDLLGSLAAAFGLIALVAYVATDNGVYDGIGSIVIGLTMMSASLLLMLDAKSLIVGRATSPETNKKIINSVKDVESVIEILDLKTMFLGSGRLMVIVEVHFADNLSTDGIEKISDQIKVKIKKDVPLATIVQVEAETPDEELM